MYKLITKDLDTSVYNEITFDSLSNVISFILDKYDISYLLNKHLIKSNGVFSEIEIIEIKNILQNDTTFTDDEIDIFITDLIYIFI